MPNIVDISLLCPIKWMDTAYVQPAPYNYKFFDDHRYQVIVPAIEEQVNFFQPWQKNDIIYLQLLSNYAGPHQLELYNCDDTLVATFAFNYKSSSIEVTGQKVYEASVALADYEEGTYYFKLKSGSPVIQELVSEVFELKEVHEYSLLLEYSHNQNDYDAVFETGITFKIRIPGWLKEYQPTTERVVFSDEEEDFYQLSAKAFATEKLILGGPDGVPSWMAEKINQVFLCSTVLIDGKQYILNDGAKMSPNRQEMYPLAGWEMEIRRADATNKKRFTASELQDNPTSIVYNIESKGFGPITGPASSNIIKIEEL